MQRITFCTTCKGRLHHLQRTLPCNIRDNARYPSLEFVILDYGSEDGLADWMHQQDLAKSRISYYQIIESRHDTRVFFNAHAKNVCALLARGDIICNVDADNFTGPDFAYHLDKVIRNTKVMIVGGEHVHEDTTGRIACQKALFLRLGGYDERFHYGWGYEDNDLYLRAKHFGCETSFFAQRYLEHISHSDEDRIKLRGQLPKEQSESLHCQLSKQSIAVGRLLANPYWDWGEAVVCRNFLPEPILVSSKQFYIHKWLI